MSSKPAHTRPSRRDRVADVFDTLGVTKLMARVSSRGRLVVLNYHRIGNPEASAHYRGVFSASVEMFDAQVRWLTSQFSVVPLNHALDLIDAPETDWPSRPAVLITFDDGYRDNHDAALPILQRHGASAAFFVATSFVGTGRVPWWDRVAYAVSHSTRDRLRLSAPEPVDLSLDKTQRSGSLEALLRLCKTRGADEQSALIEAIEAAAGAAASADSDLFMTWQHVAALKRAGMGIGAHTHNHAILSRLSQEQQAHELQGSHDAIAKALGEPPTAFAYPEGARHSFDATTRSLLTSMGYRAAFSYYGGVNRAGAIDRLDVCRLPVVSALSLPLFKLRVASAAWRGRVIF